ncbi:MAG: 4-alpha-glucanotransferase [Clostridia bacterium]|nr:4-alpha-glucanotransferase [Clostridia bacterium]
MNKRKFGILLPVSAIPSAEGIGTMGESTYRFLDYLADCGASVWQILPLNPTNYGDSPYQSCSSCALNYYFIDLRLLQKSGLLKKNEVYGADLGYDERRVDYGKQFYNKIELLRLAYSRFKKTKQFAAFIEDGKYFDFSVFMALKARFDHRPWTEWEEPYRVYDEKVINKFVKKNADEIEFWQFRQFIVLKQCKKLKAYANKLGISVMGDIPLYLAYDSVEVWKYGDAIFDMSADREPNAVAGCPPDCFSEDGQLWGNPVYDWEKMKGDGYKWWKQRIEDCFELYDILRIDHFRGFDRYWRVPPKDLTARNGKWVDGPKAKLFEDMLDKNIVAEDLGVLDDGVVQLMKDVGYPGMKVLEFAFDGSWDNEHKPSRYNNNFVCYTGTHDNMPLLQYFVDLDDELKNTFVNDLTDQCQRLGFTPDTSTPKAVVDSVVELAFASVADTVIIPVQDLLGLDGSSRMNLPSTVSPDNWSFRLKEGELDEQLLIRLKCLAEKYNRLQDKETK